MSPLPQAQPQVPPCGCAVSCPLSGPCGNPVTQEDFLCDPCREAKFQERETGDADHCHKCETGEAAEGNWWPWS